jgi:hypothetical protein
MALPLELSAVESEAWRKVELEMGLKAEFEAWPKVEFEAEFEVVFRIFFPEFVEAIPFLLRASLMAFLC